MNTTCAIFLLSALAVALAGNAAAADRPDVNYDEAKVGELTLPDPLTFSNGKPVKNVKAWQQKRRPEIVKLFETHMQGRSPGKPAALSFQQIETDPQALGGKATRKQITVYFTADKTGPSMDILLYLPNQAIKPVPVFLGPNFGGNHAVNTDPGIKLSQRWMRDDKEKTVVNNRATEKARGKEAGRWPIETILDRGYAVATIYYGDLEPDSTNGWTQGIRGYYLAQQGKTEFAPDDWGAIGAWAWGLSRAMDYLETDRAIDASRVAIMGHSRLGKTALWAGAQDERFAIVISNDSGEGGAALSRRWFGETVGIMNKSFPHWFNDNYKRYSTNVPALPVDAHLLLALMAPRPVYVASAEEDRWADPRGEFLAAKNAEPVYRLFGLEGLGVSEMPGTNQPVGKTIGYHIRTGKHDVTDYDWAQYLNFADRHFNKTKR
ncbi:MAG: acetylxylan esterase [Verrucomicrobiota bacterium]